MNKNKSSPNLLDTFFKNIECKPVHINVKMVHRLQELMNARNSMT